MRRSRGFSLLALLTAAITVALIAAAVVWRSTGGAGSAPLSFRNGVPQCLPQTEVLPTAIPTEQWTPEWLSQYSHRIQTAEADVIRRTEAAIIAQHVSMASVPRAELLISVSGPDDLDEALRKAGELIIGKVEDQYLVWDSGNGEARRAVLASTIRGRGGATSIVTQPAAMECDGSGVILGVYPFAKLLEVGREYAVVATAENDGRAAAITGHAYYVQGEALSPVSEAHQTRLYDTDTIAGAHGAV